MTAAVRPLDSSSNSSSNNNSKTANTRKTPTTAQTAALSPARRRQQSHSSNSSSSSSSNIASSNYNSLLLLAVLMCQLQQFAGGGGGGVMAAPVNAPAPVTVTVPVTVTDSEPAPGRTRLQKRDYTQLSFQESFRRELNSSVLDWSNGCGGNYTGPARVEEIRPVKASKRCAQHKRLLRTLQNKTGRELRQLKVAKKQGLSVTTWKMLSSHYTFLPRLNVSTSHLQLRRVHNDLQFYVAAFSYLRHAQLHWDYVNLQREGALSAQLLRFRNSARIVLCFVEETINATSTLYTTARRPIKTVGRLPMERRLSQFNTPLVELHHQAVLAARDPPGDEPEFLNWAERDALFLKHLYKQYLRQVTQLLAQQRKKNCSSGSNLTTRDPKQRVTKGPRRTAMLPHGKKQRKQRPIAT